MSENSPLASQSAASPVTRRDFLSLSWKSLLSLTALAGAAGLWRFMSFQTDPAPPTAFDIGPASQFPDNSHAEISDAEAVIFRSPEGFKAYSLVCPHLGCIVEVDKDGFHCPCHGSQFYKDGAVRRGPADKPLRQIGVEQTPEGNLVIHTDWYSE